MKTILFLLILLFTHFGCNEDNRIDIVPADQFYYSLNQLDRPPKLIPRETAKSNKEFVDLEFLVNSFYKKLPEEERKNFQLSYYFLVNEDGRIDKIQIINSKYPQIDKEIAEKIKDWKFEPAQKDGKVVKFSFPWSTNLTAESIDYYIAVEEMPEPIGGLYAIQSKIKYPEEAKRNGIEGKVFIQAFIDENGSVAKAKIIKGIGSGCDEAALDAVKQTKFIPGKQAGKPVKVQVSIPILFKLK